MDWMNVLFVSGRVCVFVVLDPYLSLLSLIFYVQEYQRTPLIRAADKGHLECCLTLLEAEANIEAKTEVNEEQVCCVL
jgi:hypothetical protein